MDLNPAGGASDILAMIFCTPTLYKTHANGAHLSKLIDGFKAVVHRLGQKLSKLLVVKDLQAAATGDLANRRRVEAVVIVAVSTLHKDAAVTKALGIHFTSNIVKMDSFADMPPSVLNGGVAVNIGQEPKAKPVPVV